MPLLQEILFKKALYERHIVLKNLKIDLKNAYCYNNNIKYEVIYPMSYIDRISLMDKTKKYDYNFRGYRIDERRDWVLEFEGPISFTSTGRDIETTYRFDTDYYQTLCSSRFTLCPRGDYLWSYRFFEACMCRSIPIIENKQCIDRTMIGFKFYLKDDDHIYRKDWVEHNYNLFLERHSFTKKLIN